MAIIIQNVSEHPEPNGVHEYELRINRLLIARFEHRREESLAVCLRKAADAAERAEREKQKQMIDTLAKVSIHDPSCMGAFLRAKPKGVK